MEFNATFLASILSFLVFVFIMNAILYKPILDIIEKRKKYIEDNYIEAENNKAKTQALIDDKNQKIDATNKKSKNIVFENSEKIKQENSLLIKEKTDEIKAGTEVKKQELYREKDEIKNSLNYDVNEVADIITSKFLNNEQEG